MTSHRVKLSAGVERAIFVSTLSRFVILHIRSFRKAHFGKPFMKNIRGIPGNTEKGLQVIHADSWPLHGVRGL